MAWRGESTSLTVNIELAEFTGKQLLQGLIESGRISEIEAEAIEKRYETKKKTGIFEPIVDSEEFEEAKYHISRGRKQEALIHLERWLGREWIGVLS